MRRLIALDATPTETFVDALRRAWDAGDAVLPVDPRLAPPARAALLDVIGPGREPVEEGDALVVATSGTTGVPKGVVLTHEAVLASARATSARLGVDPATDVWLACLPLAHVGGLGVVTRALLTGTPLLVRPAFEAGTGATLVSLVPTQLRRIDPRPFRRIVLGGAAPPEELPPNVVATYGMTETGSGVVYEGWPVEGVELRVDDGDQIWLRGPMLLRAYRDGSDPKDADGWLPTGDLGRLGDDGRLEVWGRAGDVVVTGGEKVWPDPVERRLRDHPGVADVAVVGRPDPEWGHRVVAVVVPPPGAAAPTLDELREWVREVLPAWCAPKQVEVARALPRTALGKLRRSEV